MALEMHTESVVCSRCGKKFDKRRGNFQVNYAPLYKGLGFVCVCSECMSQMYQTYLAQCNDVKMAVRQMCRKLDIYWSEAAFEAVEKKNTPTSIMTHYIRKVNSGSYLGKCYDDTLADEGTLWDFGSKRDIAPVDQSKAISGTRAISGEGDSDFEVTEDIVRFWGSGYTPEMYQELEIKRQDYMSKLPDDMRNDLGVEALVRQICSLEWDINRDRAAGKSVEKSVNALNNLLGSLNLKPTQRRDNNDSAIEGTPFGVWIQRWEDKRPIPAPDPEFEDADGIIKYISVWFFGHLCKMLGIKNARCKPYEDEIEKWRVEKPEYEEEDDEELFNDIFENGFTSGNDG